MAAGLLVLLLVGERMLGERAGRREHLAVSAIVVGVIGAALCAPPHTTTQSSDAVIAIVLCVLGVASLLPYIMLRLSRRPPATIAMASAGLAYGWSGVATKLASDNLALRVPADRGRVGPGDRGDLRGRGAQRDERAAVAPGDPGRAGGVRDSDGDTGRAGADAVRRALHRNAAERRAVGGVAAVLIAGAAVLARSPLLLALMAGEGERVSEDSDSAPSSAQPSESAMRSTPAHRGGRPVDGDDDDVAGAQLTLRQATGRAQADRAAHGRGAGGASEHHLADRQATAGFQEVEAVPQPERVRLGAQRAAGAHPAQDALAGRHFGQQFVVRARAA